MKYPIAVSAQADFTKIFDKGTAYSTLALTEWHAQSFFIFITAKQDLQLNDASKLSGQIQHTVEQLREKCFCVLNDTEHAQLFAEVGVKYLSESLDSAQVFNLHLDEFLTQEGLISDTKRYLDSLANNESADEAFSRLFGIHLNSASKFTLIDGYATEFLREEGNSVRELFKNHVFSRSKMSISIHAKLPNLNHAVRGKNFTKWEYLKEVELSLESIMQETGFEGSLDVNIYHYKTFPHDRHLEISLPDGSEPFAKSDIFALGNGFETFEENENLLKIRAQIYQSDHRRMWGGFPSEVRESSLMFKGVASPSNGTSSSVRKIQIQPVTRRSRAY